MEVFFFNIILDIIANKHDVILMTAPNYGLFSFKPERLDIDVEIIELKSENNYFIDPNDLENIIIKTNNITKIVPILVRKNYEYEVVDKKTVIIYDVKNVTNLIILLSENGVDILSLEENRENLETYYLNLMGGQDA